MVNKIILKEAVNENIDEISKIYCEEFSKPPFNESWTIEKAKEKLNIFSNYCDTWEIYSESALVGFLVINPNQWCSGKIIFGEEMAIKEEYQRKGIGLEVFNQIFKIYKEKGFEEYMGIVNTSSKSYGLHKKIGAVESNYDKLMERKL